MGNIRIRNMRLLKLLDITAGREYAYIYLYKYIKLHIPTGKSIITIVMRKALLT
jgi:hypothetical protein